MYILGMYIKDMYIYMSLFEHLLIWYQVETCLIFQNFFYKFTRCFVVCACVFCLLCPAFII
jgi:hypothetical protein